MKNIKRLVIVIFFFGAVFALMIPLSYALRPMNKANIGTRKRIVGFYAEPENSMDIVVVGNSGMYQYVNNPYLWKKTGLTSYNFAFSGNNVFFYEGLIDEALKTQSPELIIVDARKFVLTKAYETDPDTGEKYYDFDAIRAQRVYDNIKYSSIRLDMINTVYSDPIDRIVHYFDIISYHENWEKLDAKQWEYADNEKQHWLKGFPIVPNIDPMPEIDVSQVNEKLPLTDASEEVLRSLMEKCKNEGIELLFLSGPWIISEEEQARSNYMKDLVEEFGYQYLDMNPLVEEVGIDESKDFYDDKHVNVIGSEKVTDYLAKFLVDNYEFDAQHDEAIVDSWNKTWNSYDKKMQKYREKE